MQATVGDVKLKMQDNPKKTIATAFIVLVILLAGMYQYGIGDKEPKKQTDFDYGELDSQPDNQTNQTNRSSDNDVSENNSINVSVTNTTCVDHRNGSNYCVTG